MPKISVIVPVYNVEKYLRRCLESIKNQTFTDWQAICVNDGSPDNSAQILQEFANADARFVIVNKENGGLSDARNVGMQYATGDYVLFVDEKCMRPMRIRSFRKKIYENHFNKDYLELEQKKKELETRVSAALSASQTQTPVAMIVTSFPSLSKMPFPISNL